MGGKLDARMVTWDPKANVFVVFLASMDVFVPRNVAAEVGDRDTLSKCTTEAYFSLLKKLSGS